MSMAGYTKLFNSILASTVWSEPNETRIVWITLLAMADKNGIAEGSVPGLALFARLPVEATRIALERLSSPDPDSRTQDARGARIEAVDGGWRLINHAKYRSKMNADERKEYQKHKQREYRARKHGVDKHAQPLTNGDAVDTTISNTTPISKAKNVRTDGEPLDVAFQAFRSAYPVNRRKGGLLVEQAYMTQAARAGGPDALLAALQNHLKSAQWRNPALVPGMNVWLNEERWRQTLPADEVPSVNHEGQPDRYGHLPRCRTMAECTQKALAEARQAREVKAWK